MQESLLEISPKIMFRDLSSSGLFCPEGGLVVASLRPDPHKKKSKSMSGCLSLLFHSPPHPQ